MYNVCVVRGMQSDKTDKVISACAREYACVVRMCKYFQGGTHDMHMISRSIIAIDMARQQQGIVVGLLDA